MIRKFELTLAIKTEDNKFDVNSFDKIMADNLVSLLSQFMVLIGSIHNRILDEERIARGVVDDDIPF
jgi:hypothetical protein